MARIHNGPPDTKNLFLYYIYCSLYLYTPLFFLTYNP